MFYTIVPRAERECRAFQFEFADPPKPPSPLPRVRATLLSRYAGLRKVSDLVIVAFLSIR